MGCGSIRGSFLLLIRGQKWSCPRAGGRMFLSRCGAARLRRRAGARRRPCPCRYKIKPVRPLGAGGKYVHAVHALDREHPGEDRLDLRQILPPRCAGTEFGNDVVLHSRIYPLPGTVTPKHSTASSPRLTSASTEPLSSNRRQPSTFSPKNTISHSPRRSSGVS